jgi:DNA modification methylase
MSHVPAVIAAIPDLLARERSLRDNNHWSEWEDDGLSVLLRELETEDRDLSLLGFEDSGLEALLETLPGPILNDPELIPDLAMTPRVAVGDRWALGSHELICGDAQDESTVARLMGDSRADALVTDPPYGVAYEGGTKRRLRMANDTRDGLRELLTGAFRAADAVLNPGAPLYVFHPAGRNSLIFAEAFCGQGWDLRQGLVWVKEHFVLGRSDYHFAHEPLLFGYKPAERGRLGRGGRGWFGGNAASSVLYARSPHANPEHPTAKPVSLIETLLRNSTRRGYIVLDPFLGSGSTLIAAERLGRRCVGIELDPKYADVAIRRWEQASGQVAERIDQSRN